MTQEKPNGRNKHSHNGPTPDSKSPADARSGKRAQFEGGGKRSPLVWVVPLVALAIVAAVAVALLGSGPGKPAAAAAVSTAAQSSSAGGRLAIPVAEVSDGQVHFYERDVNGTTVKYLAVMGADGRMRTALDACQVCYQAKKGYTQQGDTVVCGNCGRSFAIDQIGAQHGGCNPIAIGSTTKGGQLLIDSDSINSGARFFQ